jgi:putative MATE family efflux protein
MMGVTAGASIITSQRFGAGDSDGMRRSFAASIVLSVCVTIVLMLISIATLKPLLQLLNTPAELIDDAYEYFVVILWGMPALTLFNLLSNMMRAVGDSKTPLYFLVIACVINIILDFVFILAFHTGVIGAGIATVIAQLFSGLACIPVIKKRLPQLCPTREDMRVSAEEMIIHAKIALPVGFQWSIIAIGTVAVTFSLNNLGSVSIAAFTTAERINQFASMPLSSYGQAMTTYSAQNFGARKYGRIRSGVLQGVIMSSVFSLVMLVLFLFLGDKFAAIFLNNEVVAIELAHEYLVISGIFFIFLALLFTFRQTIQGLGDSLTPTISGIMELLMRTAAALLLTEYFAYTGLCFASPLAFLGALIPLSISMVFKMKKLKRMEITEKSQRNKTF